MYLKKANAHLPPAPIPPLDLVWYFEELISRYSRARKYPLDICSMPFNAAPRSEAHANAIRFVQLYGGEVCSGWLLNELAGSGFSCTAHSIVQLTDGLFVDVTLSVEERVAAGVFVHHTGAVDEYDSVRHRNPTILYALT